MPVFAWRMEPTRYFGEQPTPFASVAIKSADDRWRTFSFRIDSGAVISLLCRSVGDLLGVMPEAGERLVLTGVGRTENEVFVHKLAARVGDGPELPTRFAIAASEDVPNLLGRLDIFDRFQVDFDPSLQETRFTPPWLADTGRTMWRGLLRVEAAILGKWADHPLSRNVDEAAKRFVNRAGQLVAAAAGLLKLHLEFELPLLLRSLFELAVQFEYLMRDPEHRASLYLDYEHVTKFRSEQAWLKLPGDVGDYLRNSRLRTQGEKRNKNNYERVRGQYAAKAGSERVRSHWYPGTLKDLAAEVGRTAEYDAAYGLHSAWAHGDPWTSHLLELGHGGLWIVWAYWARLLIQVANAKKIILTGDAYQSLQELAKGIA